MPMPVRIAPGNNWASLITNVMAPFFDKAATIQIIDPESSITTPYDPVTDTGGVTTPVVIWSGKAILQRVRRPATGSNQSGWTATQNFTIQIPASTSLWVRPPDPNLIFPTATVYPSAALFPFTASGAPSILVRKGMHIRVITSDDDPSLTELNLVVTVGLSGSWAPVQLMEAMAEMTSVYPHV